MYWISGAFRAVRWAPPPRSSEIAPFSTAFPPVPTAFPEDVPSPRPASGFAFAMTIFPREGVISRRDLGGAGTPGRLAALGGRGGRRLRPGDGELLLGRKVGVDGQVRDTPREFPRRGNGRFLLSRRLRGGGRGRVRARALPH